jgi:hypothetical protein
VSIYVRILIWKQGCQMTYFKPKISIWVNFGRSCNERCWYISWPLGPIYGHLVYFVAIWYLVWLIGIFFPFWYVVQRKIWQPCLKAANGTHTELTNVGHSKEKCFRWFSSVKRCFWDLWWFCGNPNRQVTKLKKEWDEREREVEGEREGESERGSLMSTKLRRTVPTCECLH